MIMKRCCFHLQYVWVKDDLLWPCRCPSVLKRLGKWEEYVEVKQRVCVVLGQKKSYKKK